MMLKMKKKMKKKAVGADGEAIDPFAPEFTSDAWFKGQQIANNKVGSEIKSAGTCVRKSHHTVEDFGAPALIT